MCGFHCVGFASGKTRCLDTVDIFLRISEFQRVFADNRWLQNTIAFVIKQSVKTRSRANAAMMVAFGADRLVFFKFLKEDHRLTTLAFVPECFGGLALRDEGNSITDAGDPVHVQAFLASTIACLSDAT